MDKDIASALDAIDKVNPFATYLDNNTLSHVGEWIDTGSYVLMRLSLVQLMGEYLKVE
jgi:hypothetical protein